MEKIPTTIASSRRRVENHKPCQARAIETAERSFPFWNELLYNGTCTIIYQDLFLDATIRTPRKRECAKHTENKEDRILRPLYLNISTIFPISMNETATS
jgi:hypothetical protein